jgi:hypothetical protein
MSMVSIVAFLSVSGQIGWKYPVQPLYSNTRMLPTVFQQVLRAPFFNLPDSLRTLHSTRGVASYQGRVDVERGSSLLARLCGGMVKLPPAMCDAPLTLVLQADARAEIWQREFNGHRLNSRMRCRKRMLCERIGPLAFRYVLHSSAAGVIYWNVARVRLLGVVPLPVRLFAGLQCHEYEQDGIYRFVVDVRMPMAGLLIRYQGWLAPAVSALS